MSARCLRVVAATADAYLRCGLPENHEMHDPSGPKNAHPYDTVPLCPEDYPPVFVDDWEHTNEEDGHEHECRDCGEGYECNGTDHWNGCDLFDGSCPECHELERVSHLTGEGVRRT